VIDVLCVDVMSHKNESWLLISLLCGLHRVTRHVAGTVAGP
jgi:hypothetical protein